MRRRFSWSGAALLALCLALPAAASASGHYIIVGNGSLPSNLAGAVSAAGGALTRVHSEIAVAQAAASDPSFAAKLAATPGIKSVVEDQVVQWVPAPPANMASGAIGLSHPPAPGPNPSSAFFFGCQWNLQQIHAPGAWAAGQQGSPNVKVAVLDTGTDPTHIDLAGKIDTANSISELTPGSSPCGAPDETTFTDFFFHGTFVSSLITSNSLGIAAVAPKANLVAVKVLNCQGFGSFGDVIAGIEYAGSLPDVYALNMSLGALIPRAGNDALIDAVEKAMGHARDRGKLVVSAAGNDGIDLSQRTDLVEIPGELPQGIGIYATSIVESLASYSNHGVPPTTWIGAPGGDLPNPAAPLPGCPIGPASLQSLVLGACASSFCGGNNFYLLGAGTSFASPMVAGVAELVDAQHPGFSFPLLVQALLAATATHLQPLDSFAFGVVDAHRAVAPFGH